ncbi:metallophosphoesterase [Sulfitobacter dubius]|uniref:metallophosphoesterase n=1 Tax=Sulfitobacter dubius TaxID=218673 RepID=UPI0022AF7AF1|nr:metallophosphoesterase [Sulfitobacter dubius]MCZ4368686.1 metallophosphoesterase [Sulfitobacter dubius]
MREYIIIPDIHADIERLKRSLDVAADTPVAFLGDFIDAGKSTRQVDEEAVLSRVRRLVIDGRAVAVMGNHELNAILYHRKDANGVWLRSHTAAKTKQHQSFIEAFGVGTEEAKEWTDWFLTLPLWYELDGLRLVHACWDEAAIKIIKARRPDGRLRTEDLPEVAAASSPFGNAVERLLSGPEVSLPEGYRFHDTNNHERHEVRLAWWRPEATTWQEACLSVPKPEELPTGALPPDTAALLYSADAPPVFVGHYKMNGTPCIEAPNAACLDYPASSCAYRWRPGEALSADNLILIDVDENRRSVAV